MNKEILELYKKHKVNPMGGCLPMILQMPVFFALYQLLIKSIEIKDANFLWIKDLSSADRLFQFKSAIPLIGTDFNILPLLTAIIMFIQQKYMSASKATDETQKAMAFMMPIMILIFFYHFAAGFVLYFLTSSLMSAIFQYRIMKQTN